MIYIVSGYRRSGTSMMMQAIHESMLEGAMLYQPGMEKFNDGEEYVPNPGGLWEVGQTYYMSADFLRQIPDDSFLKILYDGLPNLPAREVEYRIIFMTRDIDEINSSCERLDVHLRQEGVVENPKAWYPFDVFRPYRQEDIDHVLSICDARDDMQVMVLPYKDVIEQPEAVFRAIQNFGFNIDPTKAASVVDPQLYRQRA